MKMLYAGHERHMTECLWMHVTDWMCESRKENRIVIYSVQLNLHKAEQKLQYGF